MRIKCIYFKLRKEGLKLEDSSKAKDDPILLPFPCPVQAIQIIFRDIECSHQKLKDCNYSFRCKEAEKHAENY